MFVVADLVSLTKCYNVLMYYANNLHVMHAMLSYVRCSWPERIIIIKVLFKSVNLVNYSTFWPRGYKTFPMLNLTMVGILTFNDMIYGPRREKTCLREFFFYFLYEN